MDNRPTIKAGSIGGAIATILFITPFVLFAVLIVLAIVGHLI